MEFVNPVFLWGLLALGIPIIVHLFNFRRFRKVYFTNVKFIQDLQQKTQRHSQLLHLIILFLRMLAIASLVLVFAQPYIPDKSVNKNTFSNEITSIYIDNSFSMEAVSMNGQLLDEARNKAREIVSAYPSSGLFQILTNDFEGRHQRLMNKDEILENIDEIKFSPAFRKLSEVVARQTDLLHDYPGQGIDIYILSDFQKSFADVAKIKSDSMLNIYFVPLIPNKTGNLYIDSCWFESPVFQVDQYMLLKARIKNSSDESYEKIPVKLVINDRQRAIASFDIAAGDVAEVKLPFTIHETGVQSGMVEITDHPITYDDQFFISYKVSQTIPVLCINGNGENNYLKALFRDSAFTFRNAFEKNLDYSSFPDYNLIILNELKSLSSGLIQDLKKFVTEGGSIIVIPAESIITEDYKDMLGSFNSGYPDALDTINTRISDIDVHHPLFENVFIDNNRKKLQENIDLPSVFKHYKIVAPIRSSQQNILMLQNGDIFATATPADQGFVYLFAVPFRDQYSNFPRNALFVPAIYNMALLSEPKQKLFYILGKDEAVSVRNKLTQTDETYRIK